MAPLLFPHAQSVLWGDIKCVDSARRFPCASMRAPAGVDLLVPMNRWYRSRTVEGEFVATWLHMRARHAVMEAGVFQDITRELHAQETCSRRRAGCNGQASYDLRRLYRMPDILCMGWANTEAARAFACAWGHRVGSLSMREQLSFDVSRPANLSLSFGKPPHFGSFHSPQGGWGCNAP